MRSILEKMWYGNLNPQEQSFENNEETRRLLLEMEDRRAELSKTLSESQKLALEKYDNSFDALNGIIERDVFINAFCLGGKIMLGVLTDGIKF